jgi:hypothetical protein
VIAGPFLLSTNHTNGFLPARLWGEGNHEKHEKYESAALRACFPAVVGAEWPARGRSTKSIHACKGAPFVYFVFFVVQPYDFAASVKPAHFTTVEAD